MSGSTVIHVGELLTESLTLSMEGQDTPDHPYGWRSHWRDCHFADTLSLSLLKHLIQAERVAVK